MTLDHLAELRRLTSAFTVAVLEADLSAPVPTCPGWDVYDLVEHIGVVHRWSAGIVRSGERFHTDDADRPGKRTPETVSQWYANGASGLLDALATTDPDTPCWNFTGRHQTRGFWRRRQVHETYIHLVDLTRATDLPDAAVPSDVAADGIGEVLDTFMPRLALREIYPDLVESLAVVATDAGQAWTLTPPGAEGWEAGWVDGHAEGDVSDDPRLPNLVHTYVEGWLPPDLLPADRVVGDADTLMRVLWKRDEPDLVDIQGSSANVGRYLASQLTS